MGQGDNEVILYSGRTFVRARRSRNSWVSWNNRLGGGPLLVVRPGSFEISAPQGTMLESRDLVVQSDGAKMWLDRIGWAGTPFDRKECIHVAGRDQRGHGIDLALSPQDGMDGARQALLTCGVTPRN